MPVPETTNPLRAHEDSTPGRNDRGRTAGVWLPLDAADRASRNRGTRAHAIALVLFSAAVLSCSAGCAAGRGPGGEVIVGWDVAKLPETAGELVSAGASFLPPPFNYLVGGIGTLLVGGGAAGGISSMAARRARKRDDEVWNEAVAERDKLRQREDTAYDEGELRARLLATLPPVPAVPAPVVVGAPGAPRNPGPDGAPGPVLEGPPAPGTP